MQNKFRKTKMAIKKVEQVKADKGFRIWDLIIYGVIIVLVATLFIVVFGTRDKSPFKGVRVVLANEVIYEYDFENGKEVSRNSKYVETVEDDGESFVLKVSVGEDGFNYIRIDKSGSVKMTDANCGKRDCVYMGEMKDNNSLIYCSPHRLKIIPYDFDVDDGDIIM